MKKIISIAILFMATLTGWSKTFYYDQTKQITGNGFVYQCDNVSGKVTLYNADNRFVCQPWSYNDGSKLEDDILRGWTRTIEFDQENHTRFFTIIENGFNDAQKAAIGEYSLYVMAYIDPATGKIADVEFAFGERTPLAEIPIEVYYNIEQQLKTQQQYKMTEVGKKLNYGIYVGAIQINPSY
ncbi:MAG: DUF5043 domain-containing protein [Alistipes sp.]|nr:DUF5043 domain-containing protein [Alistipes sp.]